MLPEMDLIGAELARHFRDWTKSRSIREEPVGGGVWELDEPSIFSVK